MSERVDQRKRLPAGTVTLLFADIEGSTRLLHALGDRFRGVRARSRELVREAASRHGGHEVDWAGDGVFLAFERARDAVAAAVDLQRTLAEEPWAPEEAIRLRIGIHTGEPELDGEGYVGIDVVVAARICAAAHGGQVVLSRTTKDLVGDDAPAGASFRPLGDHRLKDIEEPEPLFQLVAPGLDEAFPPLATLGGATLPTLHHRLVGRAEQVDELERLLSDDDVRLVTITGPGGTGKSRLALEVSVELSSRRPVHLVGLASISDPELVPEAVARALGIREKAGRPLLDTIADALAGRHAILYLDNLEHLPAAAAHVRALLDGAPDLDVLTTSRTPLRLSGEHVLPLDPLPLDEAVELFVDRARSRGVAIRHDALPVVGEICTRLDCLPLAIELVAARLAFLSASQLLRALQGRTALGLEGPVDLPERQRTLRATLDWSYALLTDGQRALHGALAVFAGGCALEDAGAVADGSDSFLSDLEALVLGSLVRGSAAGDEIRLSMLETVREHALERLESDGRLDEMRARHARRFLELALDAEDALSGPDQAAWLERLERELDNIRAALEWSLAQGEVEPALRAMSALERFWRAHGHPTEARRWIGQGLARGDGVRPDVRARALWTAAHVAMTQSDYAEAISALDDALALFRELGDDRYSVFALCELARALSSLDDLDRALEAAEEGLRIAERGNDERALSAALDTLAMIAGYRGDHVQAQQLSERSLGLRRVLGDPLLVAASANTLGLAAMRAGDVDTAERAFEECLDLAAELGEKVFTAAALCALGEIALMREAFDLATDRLLSALEIYGDLEDERNCAECLHALGAVAAGTGRAGDAARLWGGADGLRQRAGAAPTPDERAIENRFLPAVEAELGPAILAGTRTEGRSLRMAELVAIAGTLVTVARTD